MKKNLKNYVNLYRSVIVDSINVLIVDDSNDFASSLGRSLESDKVKVTICSNPNEAMKNLKKTNFSLCLVDCILPGVNGADLAKKINTELPNAKILLMSGIFKDETFSAQMKKEKFISDFLVKPFEVSQIKNFINKNWPEIFLSELADTYTFLKSFSDQNSIVNYLKSNTKLKSYCLPKILSSLLQLEVNGTLSFKRDELEVDVIFSKSNIKRVSSTDRSDAFGQLLIELGYITKTDLDQFFLENPENPSKLPLGKRLEKAYLISPHASIMANRHQMKKRLTTLFESGDFHIEFKEHEILVIDDSRLSIKELDELTEVWAAKNIAHTWLKSVFEAIKDQVPVFKSIDNQNIHINRISNGIKEGAAISDINSDLDNNELNKSLFYAFSMNHIKLKTDSFENDPYSLTTENLTRLDRLFSAGSFYQMLDVTENSSDKDIAKSYHNLAKRLHPDKLEAEVSDEIRELCASVFAKISEAFNSIKNQDARDKYKSSVKQNEANNFIKNENAINEAKELLQKSKYKSAFSLLNNDALRDDPSTYYNLLFCWAHIKTQPRGKAQDKVIADFMKEDQAIRDSIEGYLVRALIKHKEGDINGFQNLIKLCLKKDPSYLPARRELSVVKSQLAEQQKPSTNGKGWSLFGRKSS